MLLRGNELAGYIKQQQAQAVRSLQHIVGRPQLNIISSNEEVVSNKYIQLKKTYGADIGVDVVDTYVDPNNLYEAIAAANTDVDTDGIIVQLPLPAEVDVEPVLAKVAREKDVDGLGPKSMFDPAAPTAILWLLSGYDIDLTSKRVGVIGQGRLVGAPLTKMLQESGYDPMVCDVNTGSLREVVSDSDVVIAATGVAGLITDDMIRSGQVIIDAGTAAMNGSIVGDVAVEAYERDDIKISPVPGGVGPLTVCALFANTIEAYRRRK